jgi:hypothetical protein
MAGLMRRTATTPLCDFIRHPPRQVVRISRWKGEAAAIAIDSDSHLDYIYLTTHPFDRVDIFLLPLSASGTSSDDFE